MGKFSKLAGVLGIVDVVTTHEGKLEITVYAILLQYNRMTMHIEHKV